MSLITRRRAIAIVAAASLAGSARRDEAIAWRGVAMGSEASIGFSGLPQARVEALIPAITAEIERLESALSLFRADSEISRLNRDAELRNPSADMLRALRLALAVASVAEGFDPTVQALWRAHVDWFTSGGVGLPPDDSLAAPRSVLGWRRIVADDGAIRLGRGQSITLNGLGQGYVTDRIADLLRSQGLRHVLVDLGETRALGPRDDGAPWPVFGVSEAPLALESGAVATSEGSGCILGADGLAHHLFDPAAGRSAAYWRRVTVRHPSAAVADALSTAFYAMPAEAIARALPACGGAEVWLTAPNGERRRLAARSGSAYFAG